MPVDVRVALSAAEAQHVDAFGRNGAFQRERDVANESLKFEVLVVGEVGCHCLAMFDGRDERIAAEHLEVREEHNVAVVAMNDVCRLVMLARHDPAYEAWRVADAVGVAGEVERHAIFG